VSRPVASLRHIAFGFGVLIGLTPASTLAYMRLADYGFREACVMTAVVLSAVGLQLHPLGAAGQVVTVVLVVLGLAVVSDTVALITQ
jgi:uncharacterized membrane protein YhaH (DUF805 family)